MDYGYSASWAQLEARTNSAWYGRVATFSSFAEDSDS